MNLVLKNRLLDVGVAAVAVLVGAGIVYLGDKLLGVTLEHFYGVETFTLFWVADLFLVPFIAGIVVSLIYGLGGKMLAHLCPVIVRLISYYELHDVTSFAGGGVLLPMPYWLLVVVVSAEFAAFGGVVGEILIKKTYGRSAKHLVHRKYQKANPLTNKETAPSVKSDLGEPGK